MKPPLRWIPLAGVLAAAYPAAAAPMPPPASEAAGHVFSFRPEPLRAAIQDLLVRRAYQLPAGRAAALAMACSSIPNPGIGW